jgi:hypothetical protein
MFKVCDREGGGGVERRNARKRKGLEREMQKMR